MLLQPIREGYSELIDTFASAAMIGCGLGLSHFLSCGIHYGCFEVLAHRTCRVRIAFFVLDCASFKGRSLNLLPSITMVLLLLSLLIECSPILIESFRKNPWVQQFGLKECLQTIFLWPVLRVR